MRKYSLSRRFKVSIILAAILCIIGVFFTIFIYSSYLFDEKVGIFDDIYLLTVTLLISGSGIACGVIYIHMLLDDPLLGSVSFDFDGVYFYTPLKIIHLYFDECAEIAFTSGNGFGINRQYLYIYMSKIVLLPEQKLRLFDKRSKKKNKRSMMPVYQSDYFLLQYEPEVFSGLIESVPSHFRKKLLDEARELGLKSFGEHG